MSKLHNGRMLNWKPSLKQKFGFKYKNIKSTSSFGNSVDLRELCAPIKDQGQHGACSGFSSSVATEFLELMELDKNSPVPQVYHKSLFEPVSPAFIYNNERLFEGTFPQDAGASTLADACKCLTLKGVCRESTFPYTDVNLVTVPDEAAYAEAANHRVPIAYELQGENDLLSCLSEGFPFIFGIVVYESFMNSSVMNTGYVPMPMDFEQVIGGHALCCVGYELNVAWIFQNSWGMSWGDRGFGYLPWDYLLDPQLSDDFFTLRYKD
jgi:C1A family cysteine protease